MLREILFTYCIWLSAVQYVNVIHVYNVKSVARNSDGAWFNVSTNTV